MCAEGLRVQMPELWRQTRRGKGLAFAKPMCLAHHRKQRCARHKLHRAERRRRRLPFRACLPAHCGVQKRPRRRAPCPQRRDTRTLRMRLQLRPRFCLGSRARASCFWTMYTPPERQPTNAPRHSRRPVQLQCILSLWQPETIMRPDISRSEIFLGQKRLAQMHENL